MFNLLKYSDFVLTLESKDDSIIVPNSIDSLAKLKKTKLNRRTLKDFYRVNRIRKPEANTEKPELKQITPFELDNLDYDTIVTGSTDIKTVSGETHYSHANPDGSGDRWQVNYLAVK